MNYTEWKTIATLVETINICSNKICGRAVCGFDKVEKSHEKYLVAISIDIIKGFQLTTDAIKIQAFTQVGPLIRQLMEQIAKFLIMNKDEVALIRYANVQNKIYCATKRNVKLSDDSEIMRLLSCDKSKSISEANVLKKLELCWLHEKNDSVTMGKLFDLAEMKDAYSWRVLCNSLTHGHLYTCQFDPNGLQLLISQTSQVVGVLFDRFMCAYHNFIGDDFVIDNINYRQKIIECLGLIGGIDFNEYNISKL